MLFYGGDKRIGGDYEKGTGVNGAVQYDMEVAREYTVKYVPADTLDAKDICWEFEVKE